MARINLVFSVIHLWRKKITKTNISFNELIGISQRIVAFSRCSHVLNCILFVACQRTSIPQHCRLTSSEQNRWVDAMFPRVTLKWQFTIVQISLDSHFDNTISWSSLWTHSWIHFYALSWILSLMIDCRLAACRHDEYCATIDLLYILWKGDVAKFKMFLMSRGLLWIGIKKLIDSSLESKSACEWHITNPNVAVEIFIIHFPLANWFHLSLVKKALYKTMENEKCRFVDYVAISQDCSA